MNDGVIIEDGHGSRKSYIVGFHGGTSRADYFRVRLSSIAQSGFQASPARWVCATR
jgi:hypothetical protein